MFGDLNEVLKRCVFKGICFENGHDAMLVRRFGAQKRAAKARAGGRRLGGRVRFVVGAVVGSRRRFRKLLPAEDHAVPEQGRCTRPVVRWYGALGTESSRHRRDNVPRRAGERELVHEHTTFSARTMGDLVPLGTPRPALDTRWIKTLTIHRGGAGSFRNR